MIKIAKKEKIKCTCCGAEKTGTRDYYSSSSDWYKDVGRVPICKSHIEDTYNKILEKYDGDVRLAAKRLFIMLDVYFDEELYNSCIAKSIQDDVKWLGEYMRIVNSNKKYKDKSSIDNINPDEDVEEVVVKEKKAKEDVINEELIEKWGEGFSEKEYKRLEKKYKKYDKNYPSKTLQQQVIINTICELEVLKERCRIDKQYGDYDKIHKQISAKMAELDVIPSKQKKYGEDKNMIYGVLIGQYEENDPIPEPLPDFIDLEKFEYMLNRYFIKPFKKVFGLDKDIYSIEDESNGN